ncbi:MAG: hypothetical protein V3S41_03455 [Spirochaetia bacterium]
MSRAARQSVLFDNLSATVFDIVDRVVFHRTADGLVLEKVSFYRQPYGLSDGMHYSQTPPYESGLFVRQIIENPLAERTLVLLPESAIGQGPWAARLRALTDIDRLNPDRAIAVLVDFVDTATLEPISSEVGRIRSGLTMESRLSVLLGATEGLAVIDASLAFYGITDRVTLVAAAPAAVKQEEAPIDPAVQSELDELRRLYVESARDFIDEMLFGQLLLVVEQVERSIRLAVRDTVDLSNDDIVRLNELQIQLAKALARNNLRRLVEEPDDPEIVDLLTGIDSLVPSDGLGVFRSGMNRVEELITTEFASAVDPVLDSYRQRVNVLSEGDRRTRRVLAARKALSELGTGAIAILEAPGEDLYEHIQQCMEDGSYNLIAFSDLSAEIRSRSAAFPDPDELRSLIANPVTLEPNAVFVHPALDITDDIRPPVARAVMLERARLEYELARASDSEVVVTYRPVDGMGGVVSVLYAAGAFTRPIKHYLLPGNSLVRQIRSVWDLDPGHGLSDTELEVLRLWAAVAQTAFDI